MIYSRRRIQFMLDKMDFCSSDREHLLTRLNVLKSHDAAVWELAILYAASKAESGFKPYRKLLGSTPEGFSPALFGCPAYLEVKCLSESEGVRSLGRNSIVNAFKDASRQLRSDNDGSVKGVIFTDGGLREFRKLGDVNRLRLDTYSVQMKIAMEEWTGEKLKWSNWPPAGVPVDIQRIVEFLINKSSNIDFAAYVYSATPADKVRPSDGINNGWAYGLHIRNSGRAKKEDVENGLISLLSNLPPADFNSPKDGRSLTYLKERLVDGIGVSIADNEGKVEIMIGRNRLQALLKEAQNLSEEIERVEGMKLYLTGVEYRSEGIGSNDDTVVFQFGDDPVARPFK